MSRDVGGRPWRAVLGGALGFLGGALLALPPGLWLYTNPPAGVQVGPGRVWMLCCFGGALGVSVGVSLSRFLTARREDRWPIARLVLEEAAIGYGLGLIVAVGLWWWSGWVILPICFLLLVTVACAVQGLTDGMKEASQSEKQFHKEVCQRLWNLEVERAALEAAVERKFGPLDDARRAAIQTWDEGRLTQARRKLEEARSVEELDA
jgi:hypothetical protein